MLTPRKIVLPAIALPNALQKYQAWPGNAIDRLRTWRSALVPPKHAHRCGSLDAQRRIQDRLVERSAAGARPQRSAHEPRRAHASADGSEERYDDREPA